MKKNFTQQLTVLFCATWGSIGITNAHASANKHLVLLPESSSIGFVSKQMGVPVAGKFKQFSAQVNWDWQKPETSTIELEIPTSSATLGLPQTDVELPKSVWFDAKKFPIASFKSTGIVVAPLVKTTTTTTTTTTNTFFIKGALKIKGIAQNINIPVVLEKTGTASAPTTTATGMFNMSRLQFHIGEQEWQDTSLVADAVQVTFKLVFRN